MLYFLFFIGFYLLLIIFPSILTTTKKSLICSIFYSFIVFINLFPFILAIKKNVNMFYCAKLVQRKNCYIFYIIQSLFLWSSCMYSLFIEAREIEDQIVNSLAIWIYEPKLLAIYSTCSYLLVSSCHLVQVPSSAPHVFMIPTTQCPSY
jgi:hypothetical protein